MAKGIGTLMGATQVKVVRRRVLQHDLDMYAAIAGKPADTSPEQVASEQAIKVATAAKARPWSSAVLANYLGNLTMPRIAVRVVRPEVADWVRKLSSHALDRLQEAQDRLAASRRADREGHRRPVSHPRHQTSASRSAVADKKHAA